MADDPWHYGRDQLAQAYFDQFGSGLTHAAVLFGPRRTGKTEFLLKDLGPLAQANGWRVAYASLWQSRLSPLAVLIHALTSASQHASLANRAEVLARAVRPKLKLAASDPSGSVKGELELDLAHLRGAPNDDQLLMLDDQIDRFVPKRGRALLLIDEAQELAVTDDNQRLVAALRTSLDKRRDTLATLFTGSSQHHLRRMFSERSAPFFHFGALTDWPPLDDGFVDHMVTTFALVIRAELDRTACLDAFFKLERSPYLFRKMLEVLAFDQARDVAKALATVKERAAEDLRYPETWRGLSPIQRAVTRLLAEDRDGPFSQAALRRVGAHLGGVSPSRAQVLAAVRHLMRAAIVSRTSERGDYAFDDPEFARWILERTPI